MLEICDLWAATVLMKMTVIKYMLNVPDTIYKQNLANTLKTEKALVEIMKEK